MELRKCGQLHYINALKNGLVVKAQNIFKGRPGLKYKSLADICEFEDAKSSGSFSEVCPKGECEIKVEISRPPFADRRIREIECDAEGGCDVGDIEENDCDDFGFSMMTLKEIMNRCITKKRKRPNYVEMSEAEDCSCSPSELSNLNFELEEEIVDHEVPLCSWKPKLKSKMKLKKQRQNKLVHNSDLSDISVKSELYQCNENLQVCLINDLATSASVKVEPLETDYSGCQSLVRVSANSSFTADEDVEDYFFGDPELPISFIGDSYCYALDLVPHDMDDDAPDRIYHVGSCGETEEADPSIGTSHIFGFESDEYTNHPRKDESVDMVSVETLNFSGCNGLQSISSKNEIQGQDNCETLVQNPNTSVHSNDEKECLSLQNAGNGVHHSAIYDSLPSEMCNISSSAKDCSLSWNASLSIGHEIRATSESKESGKGVLSKLFDSGSKDDATLNIEAGFSGNPMMQCSPPSDSVVNGTYLTSKDCSLSCNLSFPANSESCVVSLKNKSPTKDPIVSDSAAKMSVGIQHHDDVDELARLAGCGRSDPPKLSRPRRLLSTRKNISPVSQRRLRQIMECIDLQDDRDYKLGEKVYAGKYTPEKNGRCFAEKLYQNRRLEATFNPKQPQVTSRPKLIMKKPKDYMRDTLPKDTVETYQHSRRVLNVSTGRDCSQSAIDFSQRQMHDMDRLALRLLHELNSMKDVVKGTLSEIHPVSSLRYKTDKLQMAIKNATSVEETARKWLSTMSRDCNRFCKIMDLTGKGSDATKNAVQRERKITFADETGEDLCQVKVFQTDTPSTVQSQ